MEGRFDVNDAICLLIIENQMDVIIEQLKKVQLTLDNRLTILEYVPRYLLLIKPLNYGKYKDLLKLILFLTEFSDYELRKFRTLWVAESVIQDESDFKIVLEENLNTHLVEVLDLAKSKIKNGLVL